MVGEGHHPQQYMAIVGTGHYDRPRRGAERERSRVRSGRRRGDAGHYRNGGRNTRQHGMQRMGLPGVERPRVTGLSSRDMDVPSFLHRTLLGGGRITGRRKQTELRLADVRSIIGRIE